jgi:glycine dehydrogenase
LNTLTEHSHLSGQPEPDNSEDDGRHSFAARHIGTTDEDQAHMLKALGYDSRAALIDAVIPPSIRTGKPLATGAAMSENAALEKLRALASQNKVLRSLIGQGYYGTHTPSVILRNVLENPAWYTAYTPYQPEISQGRLEAIINFQTMVTDLTGMDIANASMLDEATAAAEAMTLCQRSRSSDRRIMFVADDVLPQTIEVMRTRAEPIGVEVVVGPAAQAITSDCFAVLLQYPGVDGRVIDYAQLAGALHEKKTMLIVAADLLALTLLKPPGQWGADVVVGNSQRFGVPLGFGGPHAAFLATRDAFKRNMPGRLVGATQDANGDPAYRLALQTREQHIRREKATSNICTAQVLLAVMASMYAVYHGPAGLKAIARRVHGHAARLATAFDEAGVKRLNHSFFDTLTIRTGADTGACHARARAAGFNLREIDASTLGISLDETITEHDVEVLLGVFGLARNAGATGSAAAVAFPATLVRSTPYLSHPVFSRYHSETEMMRYLRRLADKDIALDRAMIPLGSCTMKLNAASEMLPVTWPEIAHIHPFAPNEQTVGYRAMIDSLERMLCEATGYAGVSLQPNAGSQGEYAGLLMIRAYHRSRGEAHRDVCLIPASAHGTNPASAQMAGLRVVVVACDKDGNVDLADLEARAGEHAERLAAIMITYPSTHGVFEAEVERICSIVHGYGAQVYIDGANMNALVGTAAPGHFGGDVSHLNLHKTFCIPHGGGGPGVGPVAVAKHLVEFLPNHGATGLKRSENGISAVSAAPYGSAAILPISWMYIAMMGGDGLTAATQSAILAANYVAHRLEPHYPVLYKGSAGLIAHECILDLRPLKDTSGILVEDVAKRLIDYGFHAPTMSFPVAGTLMIEPTESESLRELDRFIDAMIAIREEIRAVEQGALPRDDNPLKHAPHTAMVVTADEWHHAYPRSMAGYPLASLRDSKYWPPVGRADNVYGDRNLFCSCIPIDQDVSIAASVAT